MPDGTSGPPRSKRRRTGRYPTYFYDRETIERTEVVSKWNTLRTLLAIDGDTPGPSASSRSSRSPSAPLPTGPTAWSSGRQPTASNGCSMGVRSSRSKPGSAPRGNGRGNAGRVLDGTPAPLAPLAGQRKRGVTTTECYRTRRESATDRRPAANIEDFPRSAMRPSGTLSAPIGQVSPILPLITYYLPRTTLISISY